MNMLLVIIVQCGQEQQKQFSQSTSQSAMAYGNKKKEKHPADKSPVICGNK